MTAEVMKLSDAAEVSSRRAWTSLEVRTLEQLAELGADAVAAALDRPVASVKLKAHRLGISLRQPGSRVGRLLGQPTGVDWADARELAATVALHAQIRADIAAGRVTLADLERAHRALEAGAELCPFCSCNPSDHPDGLCTACHRRRLAAAHRAAVDAHEAQQDQWAACQAASRTRRKEPRS